MNNTTQSSKNIRIPRLTDATLAALDALKLPLEHDIEELKRSDDEGLKRLGNKLDNRWLWLVSAVKDVEHAHNR